MRIGTIDICSYVRPGQELSFNDLPFPGLERGFGVSGEVENISGSFILFLSQNILTSQLPISLYRRLRSHDSHNKELARIRNIIFESGREKILEGKCGGGQT
jgi:hypothetical protein